MFRTLTHGKQIKEQTRVVSESKYFDRDWYLENYPDIAKRHADPAEHYLKHGWKEGRNPGPKFNTLDYLAKYPECTVCPLIFEQNRNGYVDLSIVAMMRNEALYVKEWIDYHRLVGVKRFYIYDNESTDNLFSVLEPYIGQGIVVYKYFPGLKKDGTQGKSYKDCINLYKDTTKWLAIIDADEFIVPLQSETIPEFLKDYEQYPGVVVNWCMFDSNGHITRPKGGCLENYTRAHYSHDCHDDVRLKSIVNPRLVKTPDAHCCVYTTGELAVTENKEEIPYGERTNVPSHQKIRINHYWTKSKSEYLAKIKKPRQNGKPLQERPEHYNFPDYKYDYAVWKYVAQMNGHYVREYARYCLCQIKNLAICLKHKKVVATADFIDETYYTKNYPDWKKEATSAFEHYMQIGWKKGYNPSSKFDTSFYLTKYPDIAKAGINPLEHYIRNGKAEGRLPCEPKPSFWDKFHITKKPVTEYQLLKKSKLFNSSYYLKQYPEVKKSGQDPIMHYLTTGYKEGKNPSQRFDTTFYLTTYPDIVQAGVNPLVHYLGNGKKEGRQIAEPIDIVPVSNKKNSIKNPFITVIVASYNYENYIKKTLDSLLAQTYKNFEVIVVDDGSKDNSVKVVQKYAKKYPNVFLHRHHQGANKGLIKTILLGLTKAKGDYIAFCESDDYWKPEHLQEKVNLIHKYGAPELIVNDVELFDTPTPEYTLYLNRGLRLLPEGKSYINILKYTFNPLATFSAVMFRTDILKACNFDSIIPAWTDWWLYRQILTKYPLYFIKKRLTMWRIHDSYNTTARSDKYAEELDKFILYSNILLAQSDKKMFSRIKSGKDYKIIADSDFFDEKWYLKQYPEVKKMNIPPICHFNALGWKLGYNPSPKFDTKAYLGLNSDVATANVNPLLHYLKSGQKENRLYIPCNYKETIYPAKQVKKPEKRILLVTHELSRTGAPILLLFVAQLLQKKNMSVTVLSPRDGILRKDFMKEGISVIIDAISFVKQEHLQPYKKQFDFCICNTFLNSKIYSWLSQLFPSILWIHDNLNEQTANLIMPVLSTSKDIYVPSERTKSCIDQYNKDIKMLSYPVKDVASKFKKQKHSQLKIGVCAAIQPRKGQDIFIKAVKALPKKIRSQAEFLILGKEAYPDYIKTLENMAKGVSEIKFLPALGNFEDYHEFINSLDILVCPSREDPCPLVVIDAFMHSIPVVISDHVGQKQLLDNGRNGFIFESENVSELTSILTKLIQENIPDSLKTESRLVFEKNFSEKQFLDTLKQIMETTQCKK